MSLNKSYITNSDTDTANLASKLAVKFKGNEVIELIGDLGSGKTTFVKGLAIGIKTNDLVTSPSFTLNNIYNGKNKIIHHYDFYRIKNDEIINRTLNESINASVITVVEWPKEYNGLLPKNTIKVSFFVLSKSKRKITIK